MDSDVTIYGGTFMLITKETKLKIVKMHLEEGVTSVVAGIGLTIAGLMVIVKKTGCGSSAACIPVNHFTILSAVERGSVCLADITP